MNRRKLRHELKYYVHHYDMIGIRERVKNVLTLDKNSISTEGYHIRSLYFDNAFESALYDKTNGVAKRKKYRIRIYNKSDRIIRLERKSKFNNHVLKESVPLTKHQVYQILQGNYRDAIDDGNALLRDFIFDMNNSFMRPAVVVDYIREAYIYPISDVRITFDKQLSAGVQSFDIFDPHIVTREMMQDAKSILEVKYNHFLPRFIFDLLQVSAVQRSAISKYVICKESRKVYSY